MLIYKFLFKGYRVECHYNTVQHNINMVYGTTVTEAEHEWLYSQKTPHISPSQVSYGVSIVRIWDKIDYISTAPHCIGV